MRIVISRTYVAIRIFLSYHQLTHVHFFYSKPHLCSIVQSIEFFHVLASSSALSMEIPHVAIISYQCFSLGFYSAKTHNRFIVIKSIFLQVYLFDLERSLMDRTVHIVAPMLNIECSLSSITFPCNYILYICKNIDCSLTLRDQILKPVCMVKLIKKY